MRILVAGSGHGGLLAAAKLAKGGHEVVVLEKKRLEELGYEWEDRFDFDRFCALTGLTIQDFPEGSWCYRGDTAFVSPAKKTRVLVKFDEQHRQRIMWRKPLIAMLTDYALRCGVEIRYECEVQAPLLDRDAVMGVRTQEGDLSADLVLDACGVFSPLRRQLPKSFCIEQEPKRGDLFYAYRAYFNRIDGYEAPAEPFEVSLIPEGAQGLSWLCTNPNSVDILVGRIDPLRDDVLQNAIAGYRADHPWTGADIVCGGTYGFIPVRRSLPLFVAKGYACIGDSAFMTTPMNGMGIDLSLSAGDLLAEIVCREGCGIEALWLYNRTFHDRYGAYAAKNEGLKNSLLALPAAGVDFLFDNAIIQSADLAGGGNNTSLGTLLGKLVRGLKKPKYFFAILKGIMRGSKVVKLYRKAPKTFDLTAISAWQNKIAVLDISPDRK